MPKRNKPQQNCNEILYNFIRFPIRYPIAFFMGVLLIGTGIVSRITSNSATVNNQAALERYRESLNLRSPWQSPCPFFTVVAGNDPTKAKRVLIGEKHSRTNGLGSALSDESSRCVDIITKGKGPHTILIEAAASGEEIACSDEGITEQEGRKCIGWDDLGMRESQHNAFKKDIYDSALQTFKAKYEGARTSRKHLPIEIFDRQADQFLKTLISDMEKNAVAQQLDKNAQHKRPKTMKEAAAVTNFGMLDAYKYCQSLRSEGYSYKDIFEMNTEELASDYFSRRDTVARDEGYKDHFDKVLTKQPIRQSALLDSIRKQEGFTVIVGGRLHFSNTLLPQDIVTARSNYPAGGSDEKFIQEIDRTILSPNAPTIKLVRDGLAQDEKENPEECAFTILDVLPHFTM